MNILIVCDYYPPEKLGGVGEIARNLASEYRSLGHSTYVLTTGHGDDLADGVYRTGPNLILGVFSNNWRAVRLIRSLDIDVVHLHQASTTLFLLLRLIRMLQRVVVIASFQVSYVEEIEQVRSAKIGGFDVRPAPWEYVEKFLFDPVHVLLDALAFQLADVVTAVSHETRREIARAYNWGRNLEIAVVPNGSGAPLDDGEVEGDRHLDQFIGANKAVLYLGVFRMRKRLVNVLLAVRSLLREGVPVVLVLVGAGRRYDDRLTRVCRRLGISESVIAVGPVPHDRVGMYMRRADVLCVPSSYEGMPLVILEAMAAGCVVVTSDASGMRDLITDGHNGFLVPVDDVDALTRTLKEVLEDDELLRSVREAARSEVKANYTWKQIAVRYLELVPK